MESFGYSSEKQFISPDMQVMTLPAIENYMISNGNGVALFAVPFFCCTFALANVKARYDSRFRRSMETRLTLRSPHSKQPPAWFTLGTPIRTRRMVFWKWSIAERFFESEIIVPLRLRSVFSVRRTDNFRLYEMVSGFGAGGARSLKTQNDKH